MFFTYLNNIYFWQFHPWKIIQSDVERRTASHLSLEREYLYLERKYKSLERKNMSLERKFREFEIEDTEDIVDVQVKYFMSDDFLF